MRKLTKEEHYSLYTNEEIELGGTTFSLVEEEEDMDDNFKNLTYYLKDSKGNHIMVFITLIRYGYEDYGYESDYQEFDVYKVEKREVVTVKWVTVE
ncbi:hypothetical protein [Bacillus sp. TH13]|uniref:hypothetical protein n=1 Tax=Bacillus sp. TH13 TaxID=2796379 RepID=UPI00191237A1|nr:hypothetical protein [Bacillus sp. TH13]MBK5492592.1 hypothetical protein [Bacillus sp. TH13]